MQILHFFAILGKKTVNNLPKKAGIYQNYNRNETKSSSEYRIALLIKKKKKLKVQRNSSITNFKDFSLQRNFRNVPKKKIKVQRNFRDCGGCTLPTGPPLR